MDGAAGAPYSSPRVREELEGTPLAPSCPPGVELGPDLDRSPTRPSNEAQEAADLGPLWAPLHEGCPLDLANAQATLKQSQENSNPP
eukprot:8483844-Heterocapsa_arctica.AAC.1